MPAPIDIASRPQARQPKSNLTSQLRAAGDGAPTYMNESLGARSGSISQSNGIPMTSRIRRESMVSNDLARSLMGGGGGMSWGGVSVGSWIRDDIIMTGTSPFTINSPSFHSSSYLPKLEAEFCRDFSCCGLSLPSLHDLLRHYEDNHAQQSNNAPHQARQSVSVQSQNTHGITSPIGGMGGIQMEMMRHQQLQRQKLQEDDREIQDDQQEGEVAGDMEMDEDDTTPPPNPLTPDGQLHNTLSHPPTPSTLNHPSYNTTPNVQNAQLPNLNQPTGHFSPDSSVPGTPLATDNFDYGFPPNMAFQYPQGTTGFSTGGGYSNMEGIGDNMSLDMCIDQPAKRLFSPGGQMGSYSQRFLLMANGNPEMARKLREDGIMSTPAVQTDDKPFKCPVIGCEKAYKNQNGLKYHKQHGHVNQTLTENSDGTFSIVNPETAAPYPGNMGMEKEKPYSCQGCGKRYKNLNGLKYHRSHTNHDTGLPPPAGGQGAVIAVAGDNR